jgi:ectoine hydroxylase-related dioxygenase (phytanoyl-CoA dioxygenase family)
MPPWDPDTLPKPTRDIERLKADISTHGFCIVKEAYPPSLTERLRARLSEQAKAERDGGFTRKSYVQDPDGINQWLVMLINKGSVFQEVLFHPIVTAVVEHVLGQEYVLGEMSAHITRPGAKVLSLHTDQWWMPVPQLPGAPFMKPGDMLRTNGKTGALAPSKTPINPAMCVNCMTMVTGFTPENGGTHLVPGSHLTGLQPDENVPHSVPIVQAAGPEGSVVIWDGRLWHAAGANRSNDARYGFVNMYSGPQVRTLTNFTLGTKEEVADNASPELKRLLGFKVWYSYGTTGETDGPFAKRGSRLIGELKA